VSRLQSSCLSTTQLCLLHIPPKALHSQSERQSCSFHIQPFHCSLPLYLLITSPPILSSLLSSIPCFFHIPLSTFASVPAPQGRTSHIHTHTHTHIHTHPLRTQLTPHSSVPQLVTQSPHFTQPQCQLSRSSTELHNSGPRPRILFHYDQR